MNDIQKSGNEAVYFSLKKGSNYEILFTYDRREVVEYEQFLKIAKALNNKEVDYITVNDRIVKKSTIMDMAPSTQTTKKQQEEKLRLELEEEGNSLELSDALSKKYIYEGWVLDKLYPDGWLFDRSVKGMHNVTKEEQATIALDFANEYPELVAVIEKYNLKSKDNADDKKLGS